jgi:hypothetical protein
MSIEQRTKPVPIVPAVPPRCFVPGVPNRSNCFEAEEFSGYVEGFNISRHALPVNLIEKSLGFEHADVVKIPEFHGIALLFQLWIHEFRDPIGVM